jgi:hypothetical protein
MIEGARNVSQFAEKYFCSNVVNVISTNIRRPRESHPTQLSHTIKIYNASHLFHSLLCTTSPRNRRRHAHARSLLHSAVCWGHWSFGECILRLFSDRNRWAPPSGSPGFSECRLVSGLWSPGGSRRKRKDEAVVEASGMEAVERGPVAVVGGMRIQMEQLSGDFSFLSMG